MDKAGPSIFLYEGPGFFDNLPLRSYFNAAKVTYSSGQCDFRLRSEHRILASFDCVLLRSPWASHPQDLSYSQLLAQKLRPAFDNLLDRNNGQTKIVAIGRGAQLVMLMNLIEGFVVQLAEWDTCFEEKKWLRCNFLKTEGYFFSKILDPVDLAWDKGMQKLGFDPWISCGEKIIGWSWQDRVFISFQDILACSDPYQLPNYGFEDLSEGMPYSTLLTEVFGL